MQSATTANNNGYSVDDWLDQAFEFRELGEIDRAIESCQKALEIAPDNAEAHNLNGLLLEDRDDLQGAIKAFRKAVEYDPEFEDARLNLRDAEIAAEGSATLFGQVPISVHLFNGLIFGGLFLFLGCLLYLFQAVWTIGFAQIPYWFIYRFFENLIPPLLVSIVVTMGLTLIGTRFDINRVWAFALLGGIGCLAGGTILGGLVSTFYYTLFGQTSLQGIPMYDERGPVGYTTASGLFMGLASGMAIRRKTLRPPLLLAIGGAVGFGVMEYFQGFTYRLSVAEWLYSLLGVLGAVSYSDLMVAANTEDTLREAQIVFGLGTGILTGLAGIVIGTLLSLLLAWSTGGRQMAGNR